MRQTAHRKQPPANQEICRAADRAHNPGMRSLVLVAFLSLALTATAGEYHYLIPLAGYVASSDGTYQYAYTTVQNLSPRAAMIAVTDVYPFSADAACGAPEPEAIEAHEHWVISPMICMGRASAFAIRSDEPLLVRTEIDTHRTMVAGWDKLIVDAPTSWIDAGTTAVTEAVIRDELGRKANLLVVNPSDQTLTLTIAISRPELALQDTLTVEVPARSTRLTRLPELHQLHPPPFMSQGDGRHLLQITGNGPWQGGVASTYQGPSLYVPATAFVP